MGVVIDRGLCLGCGACVSACGAGALELNGEGFAVENGNCVMCGMCVDACPAGAVSLEKAEKENDVDRYHGIWVFAQQSEGVILNVAYELLGKGRDLADQLGEELTAVCFGKNIRDPEQLIRAGADRILLAEDPGLSDPMELPYAGILTDLIRARKPAVVLCGATSFGRSLAPRVAAALQTGLTADCTELEIDPETRLLRQTRPAFGGNLMATIVCPDARPQMATVRPGVMPALPPDESRRGEIERLSDLKVDGGGVSLLNVISGIKRDSITDADLLIVAGKGIGSKKNMQYVRRLAQLLGGDYGVSRPLIDAGWAEYGRQVGQTGCSVAPKVLISLGVSGAIQHLAGIGGAKTIIAVNTDPEAPIFSVAHYAVVGDCVELMKELIAQLESGK